MGRPKPLLACADGSSFLATLSKKLAGAGIAPVVVVIRQGVPLIRSEVAREKLPVVLAENPAPERGQLSSLLTALDLLESPELEAVAVMPVDQPLVSGETIRRVAEAWRATRAPVVRPTRDGRHGHPVVFDATVFGDLRKADLAQGARAVLRAHASRIEDVPVEDDGAFDDIDTPEDYERLVGVRLVRRE